jgi:hypothetical protein
MKAVKCFQRKLHYVEKRERFLSLALSSQGFGFGSEGLGSLGFGKNLQTAALNVENVALTISE